MSEPRAPRARATQRSRVPKQGPPTGGDDPGVHNRALAARALDRTVRDGTLLDAALAAVVPAGLDGRDRAQVQALAYGAARWHHRHRAILGAVLDRPLKARDLLLESLLSVGLFQLADPAYPDHAAVSTTVGAAALLGFAHARGLVNAALRRYQRERESIDARFADDPPSRCSHPAWLVDALRADWPAHWQALLEANQRHPPMWLRLNPQRTELADYASQLRAVNVDSKPMAGLPFALRLHAPVPVAALPGFSEGAVTVQDAGAQLAALFLDARPGMRVLDACAAPGGKTTALLERAAGHLDVTAVDISAERLERLHENLARAGYEARVMTGDGTDPAGWWDGRPFDRILVDAPCTATGVIRRHPDIKLLRRATDVTALAARQSLLLEQLWPLLAPGGRLLYSTCSLLRSENEQVVDGFLERQPGASTVPLAAPIAGAVAAGRGLQLLTGAADTDGFYYALIGPVPD